MPARYAVLHHAALDSRHRHFAIPEGRRYHVLLARNRAIWSVGRWLKHYREGECTHEAIAAIANYTATIIVLSSRS